MSEQSKYIAKSTTAESQAVWVKADTWHLELGHLRALVAASEGMPDKASVTFGKVAKSYSRVDEYYATEAHVRHEPWTPYREHTPTPAPTEEQAHE